MAHQTIDLSDAGPHREGMWLLEVLQAWKTEDGAKKNKHINETKK